MSQRRDKEFAIHVAGALHVDEVATVQGAFVPYASNQVTWQRSVGGVGSNAARAAQKIMRTMGHSKLCLHAALGFDTTARQLIATVKDEGLDIAEQHVNDSPTGRYSAVITEAGELVLGLADVQLAERLSAAPIIAMMQQTAVDGLLLDANLSPGCLRELVGAVDDAVVGAAVGAVDDAVDNGMDDAVVERPIQLAAMTVSPSKALRLLPLAQQIPLIFCNRHEAMAMAAASGLVQNRSKSSRLPLAQLMAMLVDMGFNDCVLTDGGDPMIIRHQGIDTSLPIPATPIMQNVNGAGDALAGASFAAIMAGCSLLDAVESYGLAQAASVLEGNSLLPLA